MEYHSRMHEIIQTVPVRLGDYQLLMYQVDALPLPNCLNITSIAILGRGEPLPEDPTAIPIVWSPHFTEQQLLVPN